MKRYLKLGPVVKQEDIADDTLKAVAQTLRKSASLKLSQDGRKVGRVTPLLNPEEIAEQLGQRTVAVSPLPSDIDQEALQLFFSQHGKVNSVRLPKHVGNSKVFCGTALVEFSSDEEADKILGQSLTIGSTQLELKLKKEFDADRAQKLSYTKGLIVGFKLKSILRRDEAGKEDVTNTSKEADKPLTSIDKAPEDGNNKEGLVAMETEKVNEGNGFENKEMMSFEKEQVSKDSAGKDAKKYGKNDVAGCKDNENVVLREDLKAVFSKFGIARFIDFRIGEESGYVRFDGPDGAEKAAVLGKEEGVVVKNFIATLEPLTGDREKEYWGMLRENLGKYSKGRGGGKLKRGGKQHRCRDNDSGRGGSNKFQKGGGP
ncbi:La protein 1 [Linum grandiflorum]